MRFQNQHIAPGGLPADAYYGGSAAAATVDIERVTGLRSDSAAADAAMRKKLGNANWQRPIGYVWNHAGEPGSTKLELVRDGIHERISHKGAAAEVRAARRAGANRGATGRAMGALAVYLTARDALQAAGILQPNYEVEGSLAYHYVAEDGSVFVVTEGSWLKAPRRVFVAGRRRGQSEKISQAEVDEFRRIAEKEWGRYVPGSAFSEPRFYPGAQRKSLPYYIYKDGIPREASWIDAQGVHRFSILGPPVL